MQRTGAEDDFAARRDLHLLCAEGHHDAGHAVPGRDQPAHRRVAADIQIAPPEGRVEIRTGCAAAQPPSGIELGVGDAFSLSRIVVGVGGQTGFAAGLLEGARHGVVEIEPGDGDRASGAAAGGIAGAVVLDLLEEREQIGVAPAGATAFGPLVVAARLAPDEEHPVDGAGTAEEPAVRPVELAVAEMGLTLGLVLPHEALVRQNLADPEGHTEPRVPIPPACLDQKDAQVRSFTEPARQRAARRSRADYDVVIGPVVHRRIRRREWPEPGSGGRSA